MEKVVYLLGAGFSAPLGIPTIPDFILRAKDLCFKDPDNYGHLQKVIDKIDALQKVKSYYNVDLYNIEEILSILDMEDHINNIDRSTEFRQFIKDVIRGYTPQMPLPSLHKDEYGYTGVTDHFHAFAFGHTELTRSHYGQFVANLLNLRLDATGFDDESGETRFNIRPSRITNPETVYGIITTNYDLVIENCLTHITEHLNTVKASINLREWIQIAKLHGSVDEEIVAPTWKKWTVESLRTKWELAYSLLVEANQIRIIGYSLPISDSYVRYLLAAATIKSKHLKNIDVICLDDKKKTVEKRYSDFITFNYFRFVNADVSSYLKLKYSITGVDRLFAVDGSSDPSNNERYWAEYRKLEELHNNFMQR